mgnify:CR=1 FL=1
MFKLKISLVTKDWKIIKKYSSRVKPSENELIYLESHESYFRVLNVIHSIKKKFTIILVVEKIENIRG